MFCFKKFLTFTLLKLSSSYKFVDIFDKFFKNDKKDELDLLQPNEQPETSTNVNKIKNNIKQICKKNVISTNPYYNDKHLLDKQYNDEIKNHDFVLNINQSTCAMPIFNLRTFKDINFHFNFLLHNFDTKKINNLIMCKDIHKWMTTSSLSDEDLSDELAPLYYIKKQDDITEVFEYLKIFIHSNNDGTKNAFVQKGIDYLVIDKDINELIEKNLIKDLLLEKHYNSYNLSVHDDVYDFLDRFLSLVLIPEQLIGEQIHLDIANYYENKKTYEYNFNTINSDINMFNTCI